jgi:spermidine synthase
VAPCWASIPSFALPWGFSLASKQQDPRRMTPGEVDKLVADRITGALRYYDGLTHQMSFLLPKHIRTRLAGQTRIIEDNHPLYTWS